MQHTLIAVLKILHMSIHPVNVRWIGSILYMPYLHATDQAISSYLRAIRPLHGITYVQWSIYQYIVRCEMFDVCSIHM